MSINNFNLRVYGLLKQEDKILITDEIRGGMKMTKFPGGGLEFGEGLSDGLKREFQEELGIYIEVGELFYVNEFLQVSAIKSSDQLLSFYYFVSTNDKDFEVVTQKFQFNTDEPQCFRWVRIEELKKESITFPIDKIVAEKLSTTF